MNMKIKTSHIYLNILIMSALTVAYTFCALFLDYGDLNLINFLIFLISMSLCMTGVVNLQRKGINSYNICQIVMFLFLTLNTFHLSYLQPPNEPSDLYYFFGGTIILCICFYLGEKLAEGKKLDVKKYQLFSSDFICLVLLGVYLLGFLIIIRNVGIPLLAPSHLRNEARRAFSVGGISGVVGILAWLLLALVPLVRPLLKVGVCCSVLLFSGLIAYNRGMVMSIIIYIGLYFLYTQKNNIFSRRNIALFIAVLLLVTFIFVAMGEVRSKGNNASFDISEVVESKVDNTAVNWIYGYTAINYDVLKLYKDELPYNVPHQLLIPIYRLMGRQDIYISASENRSVKTLGLGLNAGTMFNSFISDTGIFYIFEVLILGIIFTIFIFFSKTMNMVGSYLLILMFISLSIFANYFTMPHNFFALVLSYILLLFCSPSRHIKVEEDNLL